MRKVEDDAAYWHAVPLGDGHKHLATRLALQPPLGRVAITCVEKPIEIVRAQFADCDLVLHCAQVTPSET